MLDLSKLESGAMPMHLVQDDMVRFLSYIFESIRPLAQTKNLYFSFLHDEPSLLMDFDAEKLRHIVTNLLSNAIKFTPEGGSVYLQLDNYLDVDGEVVLIRVKDTGRGIAAEKLPLIFDRFYQVESGNTRRGEGTGIGLTLVKELSRLMNAECSVVSEEGQGSTFSLKMFKTNVAPNA